MRTYAQYCPIVRAVDVLGERWTLLILRDMLVGSTRFNEISRGLPGLSRALLTKRLRQLMVAGLVERHDDGSYALTPAGKDLEAIVFGLADWGARYAFGDPEPEELDPEVLMWWLHDRIDTSTVDRRAVIEVDVHDRGRVFWLVIEPGDASVCVAHPGLEVDAVLRCGIGPLFQIWEGEIEFLDAVKAGKVHFTGPRWIVSGLPRWLEYSPVAPYVRAARVGA